MSEDQSSDIIPLPDGWTIIIIGLIIIGSIEVVILGASFIFADRIECNWLWCTFTTERGTSIMTEDCFTNGVRVNCSQNINWSELPVSIG